MIEKLARGGAFGGVELETFIHEIQSFGRSGGEQFTQIFLFPARWRKRAEHGASKRRLDRFRVGLTGSSRDFQDSLDLIQR